MNPEPIYDDSAVPPVLTHTHLGTVEGLLAAWTNARAVSATLRGLHDAVASGKAAPEQMVTACGEIAEQLDALIDGLAALGPNTEENQ